MPLQHLFVTGTDTGVGKTLVSAALLRRFRERGWRVAGMKPVASGCAVTPGGLRNDDALVLQREASGTPPYSTVNPFAYEPPIAPHLAAAEAGRPIEIDTIMTNYRLLAADADMIVVEGAGGWRVPLTPTHTLADLAVRLRLDVVLVVGLRLGCLNHAILTADSIRASGLRLAGWVANGIDPGFERLAANLATLEAWIPAPRLAVIPPMAGPDVGTAAAALDIASLLR